jgi:hypothetical protein
VNGCGAHVTHATLVLLGAHRSCLPEGMRKHNPKHQFQIVEHLDMTIDTLQDFLVIIREPQTKCTTHSSSPWRPVIGL